MDGNSLIGGSIGSATDRHPRHRLSQAAACPSIDHERRRRRCVGEMGGSAPRRTVSGGPQHCVARAGRCQLWLVLSSTSLQRLPGATLAVDPLHSSGRSTDRPKSRSPLSLRSTPRRGVVTNHVREGGARPALGSRGPRRPRRGRLTGLPQPRRRDL